VAHHSQFSDNWWDLNGPVKGLHAMNHLRVPFIRDGLISTGLINDNKINKFNVLEGVKILEVGCGGGILTKPLSNLKAEITALEPSEKLIETAKLNVKNSNVSFLNELIESHSQNNKDKYDAVVASEVIEHLQDKKSFLSACVESLRPGGSIFITTMNKTQPSWLFAVIAAENILNLVPKDTHDWNLFIGPEEVKKILKDLNCSTALVHGMKYEFWRNHFEWSSCTDICYALHAVKNDS
jgi:polyprenyldihydroxybenzoate methyltransferase / 3-demethylubiquinol 3-O-methyltransferase